MNELYGIFTSEPAWAIYAGIAVWAVKTYVPWASPLLNQAIKYLKESEIPNEKIRDRAVEQGQKALAKKFVKIVNEEKND